jgi:hypothetical protein
MNTQKKLIVTFAFLAGFVVTAISITRLVVFERAAESNFTCKPSELTLLEFQATDICPRPDTYVGVSMLSIAEMNISMVSLFPQVFLLVFFH